MDIVNSVLSFMQDNGLFVSTFIAAIAYFFKVRRESKQDIRHALFVLLQLRIALNKAEKSMEKQGEAQIALMYDRLRELGMPVDEEQIRDELIGASAFYDQLSGAFFELDSDTFKMTVIDAAKALSKNHPFLANRIVYMSKLPDAIETLNGYIERQKERLATQCDDSVSEEVRKNSRVVGERALEAEAEKRINELITEVETELRRLAWSSGVVHWYAMRKMLKLWRKLDQQPSKEEADKDTDRLLSDFIEGVKELNNVNKKVEVEQE